MRDFDFMPFKAAIEEEQTLKQTHDAYDVYLEEEYIGKKTLLTEPESIDDVLDFLKSHGVKEVSAELTGDHYVVSVHGTEDEEHAKRVLKTYLQHNL